jgi:hypothetical protein
VGGPDLRPALSFGLSASIWTAPASLVRAKSSKIRFLSIPYLVFLKIITLLVHFGLPALAIALTLIRWFDQISNGQKLITVAIIFIASVATLQLIVGIIAEIRYPIDSVGEWSNC